MTKGISLKKKIALGFFISAFIIAILAVFEYINFVELRKEIRYLEITDTLSRKSLQLRRHEKNFLLYSPLMGQEEAAAVHDYIGQIKDILAQNPHIDEADQLSLRGSIAAYERKFGAVEAAAGSLTRLFEKVKAADRGRDRFIALVEATFLEQPSRSSEVLVSVFGLSPDHSLVVGLRTLDKDISGLRKTGEDIMVISKDLDKIAREKAETVIRVSQLAIIIFFPLFFAVGIGMLFFITTNVVRRLMLLIRVVEATGKGSYPQLTVPAANKSDRDEVGVLIDKFNAMENQLEQREQELDRKNHELMQAKKLAAIGTLASGVAHELNNPLNNIYLSAQVLEREAGESCSPHVKEVLGDILSQTGRVKKIVGDLLEFARGREPRYQEIDLAGLLRGAFNRARINAEQVAFRIESCPETLRLQADAGQLEQVFINLFANAIDAMKGRGELRVSAASEGGCIVVRVSDAGSGIPREALDKIFEPFFTTKDKGTGLGLAIVYNIVKKHNGDIVVDSDEDRGTTFTITLPTGPSETEACGAGGTRE